MDISTLVVIFLFFMARNQKGEIFLNSYTQLLRYLSRTFEKFQFIWVRILFLFISLITIIPFSGCSHCNESFSNIKTMFDERPYEGRFLVFGRVLNDGNTGVNECSVILIKREFNLFSLPLIARTFRESPVARTDSSGDFSFFFEPLESNNIWLYFEAQGYVPRFIDIDDLFRGPLYRRPPNNPLNISVVLERQVISKDTVVQEMDDSDETQVPDQEEW